jgi:hypothetical protein
MKPLHYFYKKGIPLTARGEGLFKLGDTFEPREGVTLRVVEVVPYGMYPEVHPKLRVYGYYREQESYVVEDGKGNRRWPLVGSLLKMKKVG